MKLLIDSSTAYLLIGIVDKDNVKTYYREGKNDHSETLVDLLKKFIFDNNYTLDDIEAVFVGRGPGSYTGLRISGTVGKVLAYLKDYKLYSFSSLDLIMAYKLDNDGLYLPMIDAKRDWYYYKLVNVSNNKINLIHEESFGPADDILDEVNYEGMKRTFLQLDEEFLNHLDLAFKNIIKYNLYQEESSLDYSPNYLRSVI